jgi:hypothetical protein
MHSPSRSAQSAVTSSTADLDAVRVGRKTMHIEVKSVERFIDARPVGNWR